MTKSPIGNSSESAGGPTPGTPEAGAAPSEPPAALLDGLAAYNRGRYLEAQERLEAAYGEVAPEYQPLVRALLMVACAMHLHFHRGGGRGVVNLFAQALVALDDYRPEALGVDVAELSAAVEAYAEELKSRRRRGPIFFDRWLAPRIHYRRPPLLGRSTRHTSRRSG